MTLTEGELLYLATTLGTNTGLSLIRPSNVFTGEDAIVLRNKIELEIDRRKAEAMHVANN